MTGWTAIGTTIDGARVYAAPIGTPLPTPQQARAAADWQKLVAEHEAEMDYLARYGYNRVRLHNGRKPTARRRRRG